MLSITLPVFLAVEAQPLSGAFASPIKLILALVLAAAWLALAPKINADAIYVNINRQVWSGVYLAAGAIGLLMWLLIPIFLVGLFLFLGCVSGTLMVYLSYRNAKVDPTEQIGTAAWFRELRDRRHRKPEKVETKLRLYGSDGRAAMLADTDAQNLKLVHGYNLAQALLYDLVRLRAGEADVAPQGGASVVRCVVDGVIQQRPSLSLSDAEAIIQYLKEKAGVDVRERRRPQKGKISVDVAGAMTDIQVAVAGTNDGQRMQLRMIQELVQTNLDLLGLDEDLAQKLLKIVHQGKGILLVSGPGKSGVTSTLYSLMMRQDAYMKNLVAVEARSAMDMENVTQNEYGEANRVAEVLASTMRREPDVILLDQCPDAKTAVQACEFAQQKFMVIGIRAKDALTALAKWVMVVGDPGKAVRPLRGVLCQTLIRKLCPTCREPYQPDAKLLAKINLPPDQVSAFYRPPTQKPTDNKGNPIPCQTCQDSGYYGRTGVFEYLDVTDELRQLVAAKAPITQIKAAARKNKMRYLQEQALAKVVAGITSIQEVIRAFQSEKK